MSTHLRTSLTSFKSMNTINFHSIFNADFNSMDEHQFFTDKGAFTYYVIKFIFKKISNPPPLYYPPNPYIYILILKTVMIIYFPPLRLRNIRTIPLVWMKWPYWKPPEIASIKVIQFVIKDWDDQFIIKLYLIIVRLIDRTF